MSYSLPKPITDLIDASKRHDANAFLAAFSDDAMVSDKHRPFFGKAALSDWSAEEFIGKNVEIEEVTHVKDHHGDLIVTAWVSGAYAPDKGADKVELSFYFVVRGDKIVKTVILPAMGQGQDREAA